MSTDPLRELGDGYKIWEYKKKLQMVIKLWGARTPTFLFSTSFYSHAQRVPILIVINCCKKLNVTFWRKITAWENVRSWVRVGEGMWRCLPTGANSVYCTGNRNRLIHKCIHGSLCVGGKTVGPAPCTVACCDWYLGLCARWVNESTKEPIQMESKDSYCQRATTLTAAWCTTG